MRDLDATSAAQSSIAMTFFALPVFTCVAAYLLWRVAEAIPRVVDILERKQVAERELVSLVTATVQNAVEVFDEHMKRRYDATNKWETWLQTTSGHNINYAFQQYITGYINRVVPPAGTAGAAARVPARTSFSPAAFYAAAAAAPTATPAATPSASATTSPLDRVMPLSERVVADPDVRSVLGLGARVGEGGAAREGEEPGCGDDNENLDDESDE